MNLPYILYGTPSKFYPSPLVHDVIMQVGHYKMNFICNPIHVLLEPSLDKGCNPKPWQKKVGHCLDLGLQLR